MHITSLPLELVDKICSYLHLPAWCALRLTCRSLFLKTLHAFRRVFRSISVLCTPDGLLKLWEISMHEGICERVEELRLVPELFNGEYDMPPHGFVEWDCIRIALKKQRRQQPSEEYSPLVHVWQYYENYEVVMKDHRQTLKSPTTIRVLQHCLNRFVNLTTVGLRYRPAEGGREFICLGWRSITDDLGYPPTFLKEFQRYEGISREQDRGFCVLVRALVASEWASFLSLMQGLENLHLCLEGTWLGHHPERPRELLTTVGPTLEVLRYQFDPIELTIPPTTFPILEIFPGIQFPRLRDVRLQNMVVPTEALTEFLRGVSSTLRDLTLKAVSLAKADDPFGQEIPGETKDSWQHVLEFFRDELSLEFLVVQDGMFKKNVLGIIDASYTWDGAPNQRTAAFHYLRTGLSFVDWVEQLHLEDCHDMLASLLGITSD
ncbi:hypothetical protein ASPBRDRAFT_136262 [Aspergillus brasiliensis CBS 101740]|uniref:F-box domain-containing protein n=1 Tax=Aspergillus brasiliensis (strain CBS 101740 / IMI 381727 / IBT 21946) TaxID=767769 RepID=A0A1L9U5Z0_ASPBC|nr:hypothetical protein ASPBRDRAFT_136262 [Aspergillus brasiliensis CBS 101740]